MNLVNMKEILPIGSVITLKGRDKKIMVCGRIQEEKKSGKLFDYSACYYPEGILEPTELFLFQHEDVDKIYYVGLKDADEFAFQHFMKEKLEELDLL